MAVYSATAGEPCGGACSWRGRHIVGMVVGLVHRVLSAVGGVDVWGIRHDVISL